MRGKYKIKKESISNFKPGTKEYKKDRYLFHMYGITLTEYNNLYNEQNGCCKICNKHQMEFKHNLSIDHCHKTNEIRGLLCVNCNHGLGKFQDNVTFLENAIKYLNKK
jgi:hypothetical protein